MKSRRINNKEINNALGALFNPTLDTFSKCLTEPTYLQDVEDFSSDVLHFDEHWNRFSKELQSIAEQRGVKIVVKDDVIELKGSECAAVTFTLCDMEEDADSLEIDFSELDGMTRDEAIDYLEYLPSEIEPFQYVRVGLSNLNANYQIATNVVTVYPNSDILSELFDCFDNESKAIDDAERKYQTAQAELAKSGMDSIAGTTAIVEGLKALGWSGKYVVERTYSGFILMILLPCGNAARIGCTAEDIVKNLPEFLSFCKNYPNVENRQAYFVRTCELDSTVWDSL